MSTNLVPCSCVICQGRKITPYQRRQHRKKFSLAAAKDDTSYVPPPSKRCVKLAIGDVGSPLSTHHPDNSTSATGDADDSAPFEEVIPTVDLHGAEDLPESSLSGSDSQSSDLDDIQLHDDSEGVDGDREFSASVDVSSNDDTYIESVSISKLDYARFDASLYDDPEISRPLYPGSNLTLLQALVKYMSWFTEHPYVSKEAMSDMLKFQHASVLPSNNVLPDSFPKALKLLEPFLVKPSVFDCCRNDCIIFRGKYLDLSACPKCGSSRYRDNTKNKVPVKRFIYLPLGPRLLRMFGTANLSQLVQSHGCAVDIPSLAVDDIHHSVVWKDAYERIFDGDSRGVSLAFCTDGVNPFKRDRISYSMWPIMLTLLNLPRAIRNSFSNVLLVGIVPPNGPKEPNTLDPYLEILVDEILMLSSQSIFDAYANSPFTLKIHLMSYVLDYPGIGKTFCTLGAGAYHGCLWCSIEGTYDKELRKMVYLQNRRFLEATSALRKDHTFPDNKPESRPPPSVRDYSREKFCHEAYERAQLKTDASTIATSTGCKSRYSFMKLPEHDRVEQTVPDAMHTVKDVVERLFKVIIGKSKSDGHRDGCCLSANDIHCADNRILKVNFPSKDFTPGQIFSRPIGLKSHDWKELVCTGALKFCIRDMLHDKQRQTLFLFLDALSGLFITTCDTEAASNVKRNLNYSLALLERDFPTGVQVMTTHLLHHIPDGMQRFGPVHSTWMYAYERFNSWMGRRAMNRCLPEATIMATYRIFEWCQYMVASGRVADESLSLISEEVSCSISLNAMELQLLDKLYMKVHVRYQELSCCYDLALKRATTSRRKSLFPPKCEWIPPPPITLNQQDKLLLKGPLPSALKLKQQQAVVNHRKVVYSTSEHESTECRHKCSFVTVSSQESVKLCRIQQLFKHTFAGIESIIALVKMFINPQVDQDSKLYFVNDKDYALEMVTLDMMSEPKVIAYDGDILWFLNVNG